MENTEVNMFEIASRNKYRFTFRGLVTVEDLWDLSVEKLDDIFKTLNAQLKQTKEESLLEQPSKEDEELAIKIKIVKHIVMFKLDERAAKFADVVRKEKKQKIMEIMARKQDQDLESKSLEELSKMVEEL